MKKIPTFIIIIQSRTDRGLHTIEQFKDREEFSIVIIEENP